MLMLFTVQLSWEEDPLNSSLFSKISAVDHLRSRANTVHLNLDLEGMDEFLAEHPEGLFTTDYYLMLVCQDCNWNNNAQHFQCVAMNEIKSEKRLHSRMEVGLSLHHPCSCSFRTSSYKWIRRSSDFKRKQAITFLFNELAKCRLQDQTDLLVFLKHKASPFFLEAAVSFGNRNSQPPA